MTKTRPSADPPDRAKLVSEAKRVAVFCRRDFDMAASVQAADDAARWLKEVRALYRMFPSVLRGRR